MAKTLEAFGNTALFGRRLRAVLNLVAKGADYCQSEFAHTLGVTSGRVSQWCAGQFKDTKNFKLKEITETLAPLLLSAGRKPIEIAQEFMDWHGWLDHDCDILALANQLRLKPSGHSFSADEAWRGPITCEPAALRTADWYPARAELIRQLTSHLLRLDPVMGLLTPGTLLLTGVPGCGKHEVGSLLARASAVFFAGGILYGDLAAHSTAQIADDWAARLGLTFAPGVTPAEKVAQVVTVLRRRGGRWLVFLAHAQSAAQLAPFLALHGQTALLITVERQAVGQALGLELFEFAVPGLSVDEALCIWRARLPQALLAPKYDRWAGEAVALLDGHAVAVNLLGGVVNRHGWRETMTLLRSADHALDALEPSSNTEVAPSVRAILRQAAADLSVSARELLDYWSWFAPGEYIAEELAEHWLFHKLKHAAQPAEDSTAIARREAVASGWVDRSGWPGEDAAYRIHRLLATYLISQQDAHTRILQQRLAIDGISSELTLSLFPAPLGSSAAVGGEYHFRRQLAVQLKKTWEMIRALDQQRVANEWTEALFEHDPDYLSRHRYVLLIQGYRLLRHLDYPAADIAGWLDELTVGITPDTLEVLPALAWYDAHLAAARTEHLIEPLQRQMNHAATPDPALRLLLALRLAQTQEALGGAAKPALAATQATIADLLRAMPELTDTGRFQLHFDDSFDYGNWALSHADSWDLKAARDPRQRDLTVGLWARIEAYLYLAASNCQAAPTDALAHLTIAYEQLGRFMALSSNQSRDFAADWLLKADHDLWGAFDRATQIALNLIGGWRPDYGLVLARLAAFAYVRVPWLRALNLLLRMGMLSVELWRMAVLEGAADQAATAQTISAELQQHLSAAESFFATNPARSAMLQALRTYFTDPAAGIAELARLGEEFVGQRQKRWVIWAESLRAQLAAWLAEDASASEESDGATPPQTADEMLEPITEAQIAALTNALGSCVVAVPNLPDLTHWDSLLPPELPWEKM